jgi:hypothetical protein
MGNPVLTLDQYLMGQTKLLRSSVSKAANEIDGRKVHYIASNLSFLRDNLPTMYGLFDLIESIGLNLNGSLSFHDKSRPTESERFLAEILY